jgi:hypothetical protein
MDAVASSDPMDFGPSDEQSPSIHPCAQWKHPLGSLNINQVIADQSRRDWKTSDRHRTPQPFPCTLLVAGCHSREPCNMRLKAGAIRELHWHKADEWGFVIKGRVRVTAVDESSHTFVDDVGEGDIWNFPVRSSRRSRQAYFFDTGLVAYGLVARRPKDFAAMGLAYGSYAPAACG